MLFRFVLNFYFVTLIFSPIQSIYAYSNMGKRLIFTY